MGLLLSGRTEGYAQFITVLAVFVLVLGITAAATKWMAGYQRKQGAGCNIQVIETSRIGNNKYLQIVRVGDTYMAIAVCKDTVTMLGEIPCGQLKLGGETSSFRFQEILDRAAKKNGTQQQTEESREQDGQ